MTIEELRGTVLRSGQEAQIAMGTAGKFAESGLEAAGLRADAIQWMQVKMLAEIALQLRLMNDGSGCKQPEEA